MGTLHPLPTRRSRPGHGYCMTCGCEMTWPSAGAWPESCPNGCAPFSVQSWPPDIEGPIPAEPQTFGFDGFLFTSGRPT